MNFLGLQGFKPTLSQRNFSVTVLGWDSKDGWREEQDMKLVGLFLLPWSCSFLLGEAVKIYGASKEDYKSRNAKLKLHVTRGRRQAPPTSNFSIRQ